MDGIHGMDISSVRIAQQPATNKNTDPIGFGHKIFQKKEVFLGHHQTWSVLVGGLEHEFSFPVHIWDNHSN